MSSKTSALPQRSEAAKGFDGIDVQSRLPILRLLFSEWKQYLGIACKPLGEAEKDRIQTYGSILRDLKVDVGQLPFDSEPDFMAEAKDARLEALEAEEDGEE